MQTDSTPIQKDNVQIARAVGTVMAAFVVSKLVGLLATTLTARTFGTSVESNCFFAANRFSEILFNLVAGGALGSAFIPVFTDLLAHENKSKAWMLASAVSNLVSIVLLAISLLTIIFARQVVHYVLAPGFSLDQEILTAQLLRIQVISSVIFGMSGLVMGILNAHQHFLLPAIAPAMYQLAWIVSIYLLKPTMGIFGLAWGVVAGAALHLLVQVPKLLQLPQRKFSFSIGLHMPEVREVARLMAPRLLGVAVVQLNFLLNTLLASYQPEGSIAAINLAFPLMIMPETAIAQSIAIAAFPTFAMQVARNQLAEMRSSLSATLRFTLLLALPATVGMILLRQQIVSFLYEGQEFTAHSTQLVTWALLWYLVGLIGHCTVEIISRAFYALHDTRTPVMVGVGAMSLNLVLSFAFVALFNRLGWMPHGGLALANSTATLLESLLLVYLMRRKMKGIDERRVLISFGKSAFASTVMGLAVWLLSRHLQFSSRSAELGVLILGGIVVYALLIILLRSEELSSLKRLLKTRG
jgi:putative peptidoglycan lipid II flippase